jgi:mannose-6-phosphate isomerase-like protein (cupin superfamily)
MMVRNKKSVEALPNHHGEIVYEIIRPEMTATRNFSLAHIELLPGQATEKHFHPRLEECYVILQGSATMIIEDEKQIVKTGDVILIPPKEVHQIINDGKKTLNFLAFCAPGWTPEGNIFVD